MGCALKPEVLYSPWEREWGREGGAGSDGSTLQDLDRLKQALEGLKSTIGTIPDEQLDQDLRQLEMVLLAVLLIVLRGMLSY